MTGCFWFYHASKVIGEAAFSLTESSLWSIALIIDPLTNVILDRTVSKQAVRQVIVEIESFYLGSKKL